MRLLNAWTFEIKEFMGSDSEIYAMLSHTWETEEVTFADFRASSIPGPAGSMNGFKKIIGHCEKARMEGYDWIWIDTCCIDKSSSAELSEAINSMFHWYENAGVCYVYLSDVKSDEIPALADSSFRKSRWFTRGWTLQELIAPQEVVFLAADWEEIGSRWELSQIMSEITNIDEKVLKDPSRTVEFSSAQRMSWASMRKTTRIEDQAYSLLGIFNVQMPLLYGEGSNAFKRLQIEVLNSSNDSSLLAW
ncbi:HET-domain-containing protein, partial [Mollisia scopiformis]